MAEEVSGHVGPVSVGGLENPFLQFLETVARHEAGRRLSRLALAAERHRLAHGRYPKEPPYDFVDPFDGKPIRYRVQRDVLLVWSVGPNGEDDDGKGDDIVWRITLSSDETLKEKAERNDRSEDGD